MDIAIEGMRGYDGNLIDDYMVRNYPPTEILPHVEPASGLHLVRLIKTRAVTKKAKITHIAKSEFAYTIVNALHVKPGPNSIAIQLGLTFGNHEMERQENEILHGKSLSEEAYQSTTMGKE
jgi:hypothetical protein